MNSESCRNAILLIFRKVSNMTDGNDNNMPDSQMRGNPETPSADTGPLWSKHRQAVKLQNINSDRAIHKKSCTLA